MIVLWTNKKKRLMRALFRTSKWEFEEKKKQENTKMWKPQKPRVGVNGSACIFITKKHYLSTENVLFDGRCSLDDVYEFQKL